jgi:SP family general alpha glucoside:H+ symporter-like MFS transporter
MFVALPFIPESPWYLVRRGTPDKALRSLARLYRGSGDDIEQHLARIQEVIYIETHNKEDGSFLDLFRGTNRLRTFVASMVFVCQEMVGVQFVLGFATYFFELGESFVFG